MRARSMIVGALALIFAMPAAGVSQDLEIGPQVSWGGDTDIGIGVRAVYGIESLPHWDIIGSFDIFFPDEGAGTDVSYWEVNVGGAYNFLIDELDTLFPYAGAGLNVGHASVTFMDFPGSQVDSSSTDIGLNLFAGTRFNLGSLNPFGEIRYTIEGAAESQIVLTAGLLFGI